MAVFACQALHLLLHHHHLHTFVHPRSDSYVLLVLELMLCARRLLIDGMKHAQAAAERASMPRASVTVGALAVVASFMAAWFHDRGDRPITDVIFLIPPGVCAATVSSSSPCPSRRGARLQCLPRSHRNR